MKILVGWEVPEDAFTLELLLNVDGNEASIFRELDAFKSAAEGEYWDVILLSLDFPSREASMELFAQLQAVSDGSPIVGACQPGDTTHLIEFLSQGLHSHVVRDAGGDFMMLLTSVLESAYETIEAMKARVVAERLSEEVDSVRKLQESVIPSDLPKINGYSIVGRYEPSEIKVSGRNPVVMAGGDYYDSFMLNDEMIVLLVGDASGHGVKACMSIMTMHTLIRMIKNEQYPDAAEFVSAVNDRLCTSDIVQDEGGFITLLYSMLNVEKHQIEWTCAGHPLPLLQDLATNEITVMGDEDDVGLPLAISAGWPYEKMVAEIPDNSRVLIYTDGLEEAYPPSGDALLDQFGVNGIIRGLQESKDLSLDVALDHIFDLSSDITEGAGRHDDTSVILIERKD